MRRSANLVVSVNLVAIILLQVLRFVSQSHQLLSKNFVHHFHVSVKLVRCFFDCISAAARSTDIC